MHCCTGAPEDRACTFPRTRPKQAARAVQVIFLHRLEDPAAQPPYLLLMVPPVHTLPGVTIETGAGPQVRSPRCPTCLSVPAFALASSQRLTCPRQRPCGPEHQARYPASYMGTFRGETRPCGTRFPAAFRPPAFAFWAPCPARDFRPSYDRPTARPALTRACRADLDEVYTFRTHETRTGSGALYTPGRRCPLAVDLSRPPPAASQRPAPRTPVQQPSPGCISDEASARVPWQSPCSGPSPHL